MSRSIATPSIDFFNRMAILFSSLLVVSGCTKLEFTQDLSKLSIPTSVPTATPRPLKIDGNCGASHKGTFDAAPTGDLCNFGKASSVELVDKTFVWLCEGSNGGENADCSASLVSKILNPINGTCGEADGKDYTDAPSSELCKNGTPSSVTLADQVFTWGCHGLDGGQDVACSAKKVLIVNGKCGSSGGKNWLLAPTENRCLSGLSTDVKSDFTRANNNFSWSCLGSNGGTSEDCFANLMVNGTCGPTNGQIVTSVPASGLCLNGAASTVESSVGATMVGAVNTTVYKWNCAGVNGGTTSNCNATQRVVPLCGTSNGQNFSAAPASNLCSPGSSGSVTLSENKFRWNCSVTNGSSVETIACTANQIVNGACGSSNGVATRNFPTTNLCASGTPSPAEFISNVYPAKYNWSCSGINTGSTASCSAPQLVDPACGSSNGQNLASEPTSNLCANGTASTISLEDNKFKWSCTTNVTITNTQMCYANKIINGTCGSANGQYLSSVPNTNLCAMGSASPVESYVAPTLIATASPLTLFKWTCSGANGGDAATCGATQKVTPMCGKSSGQTVTSAPTSDLCSAGTASAVVGSTNNYNWSCSATNGGITESVSCNANLLVIPVCSVFKEVNLTSLANASSVPVQTGEFVRFYGGPVGQRYIIPKESCAIIEAPRVPSGIGFRQIYSIVVDAPSPDYSIIGFYGLEWLKNNKTGQTIVLQLPIPAGGGNNFGVTVTFTDGSISLTSNQNIVDGAWTAWVTQGVAFGGDTSVWSNPVAKEIPPLVRSGSSLFLSSYLTSNPSILNTQEKSSSYSFPPPSPPATAALAGNVCPNPRVVDLGWQPAGINTVQKSEHLIAKINAIGTTFVVGESSCLTVIAPELPVMNAGFKQLYSVALKGSSSQYKVTGFNGVLVLTNIFTNQQLHLQIARPSAGSNNFGINVQFSDGSISLTTFRNETVWNSYITQGVAWGGNLDLWKNAAATYIEPGPMESPISLATYLTANPSILNTSNTSAKYSFP